MRYIGIDPGIVTTGIAVLDGRGAVIATYAVNDCWRPAGHAEKITRLKRSGIERRLVPERLAQMVQRSLDFVRDHIDATTIVAIEEPFVYHNGATALKTYGVFAALAFSMHRHLEQGEIANLVAVPVPTLKSFIGAKQKPFVIREVFRRWGFAANDHNVVDAYLIARYAMKVKANANAA